MKGIILMGLQASGKSTFCLQRFNDTYIRLNLDMLKTRNRERILFDACMTSKTPCVIDNTNPRAEDRVFYIEQFKKHRFDVDGYCFISNINSCLKRNDIRQGKARVPENAIKATRNKFEYPSFAEGFDRLYAVRLINEKFVVKEWNDEV
ncbi:AAA family ATPase [Pleionea sp. CnH1-48]|uniref:AAA family ATPase n=1 Tax=Pleionea sp. CnH1-48 TaxID=2954494 RepID=UPI002097F175|nr:AAA family ATPase [Pleionea sp. CnH1-48]MCO7223294.1 AAA family ATPase [Pleionea sp. CnH1-48]